MPFSVSKWPHSDDPRTTAFCPRGYAPQGFPPYLWRLSTIGADAPFNVFNSGYVVPFVASTLDNYLAANVPSGSDLMSVSMFILGYESIQVGPPHHTIWIEVIWSAIGVDIQRTELKLLWPSPVAERTLPAPLPDTGPPFFHGPVVMTPVPWWTPPG